MSNPVLRPWTADDCDTVRRIARDTWMAAYGSFIPEADLQAYLDAQYADRVLQEKIGNPSFRGVIASWDGIDAAYMIVAFAPQESRCYVSSVYVLPSHQGKGIGGTLLKEARRCAREKGLDRIWLGVMTENSVARAWYERNGFLFTERAPFTMGSTTVEHLIGYQLLNNAS